MAFLPELVICVPLLGRSANATQAKAPCGEILSNEGLQRFFDNSPSSQEGSLCVLLTTPLAGVPSSIALACLGPDITAAATKQLTHSRAAITRSFAL